MQETKVFPTCSQKNASHCRMLLLTSSSKYSSCFRISSLTFFLSETFFQKIKQIVSVVIKEHVLVTGQFFYTLLVT